MKASKKNEEFVKKLQNEKKPKEEEKKAEKPKEKLPKGKKEEEKVVKTEEKPLKPKPKKPIESASPPSKFNPEEIEKFKSIEPHLNNLRSNTHPSLAEAKLAQAIMAIFNIKTNESKFKTKLPKDSFDYEINLYYTTITSNDLWKSITNEKLLHTISSFSNRLSSRPNIVLAKAILDGPVFNENANPVYIYFKDFITKYVERNPFLKYEIKEFERISKEEAKSSIPPTE